MRQALDIARTILAGFDRHYKIFRDSSLEARIFFEKKEWGALRQLNRSRIDMYNQRVIECAKLIQKLFPSTESDEAKDSIWAQVKIEYIGLLYRHLQPELAETFFNSVTAKVIKKPYYNNKHAFTSPAVSAEHIEGKQATYRCYYLGTNGVSLAFKKVLSDFGFDAKFRNLEECSKNLARAFQKFSNHLGKKEPNFHLQVLSSPFFSNVTAYAIGRVVNGHIKTLFAIPLKHNESGIYVDAFLSEAEDLSQLLSVNQAYFFVDMEVPSSWISFIHGSLPGKTKSEIYTTVGLQGQGKILFVRDLRHHLKNSTDQFVVAPGVPGMVMTVFTMPSFPFVFKMIRDYFEPPKDSSKQDVLEKYRLVKIHDRVGRLADTLEYFNLDFPLDRFSTPLLELLQKLAPSNLTIEGQTIVFKHAYIEQRMVPLNIYVEGATSLQVKHAAKEYGNALRELALANVFPGDLLLKNFGVTRNGRVLFYDYDEVSYLTDCNFRSIPGPRDLEDETRLEPWFGVGHQDVFPEEFLKFLFHEDSTMKKQFLELHSDLLSPKFWKQAQEFVRSGVEPDLSPYPNARKFSRRSLPSQKSFGKFSQR